jgi:adenosine/AMP kinase
MQRLTSLCSVLNDMEPICVLNHVFVLREVCTIYVHWEEVNMHVWEPYNMLGF